MSVLRVTLSELKRLSGGILPKLVLLSMTLIPLLYGGIYLYANWDPYNSVDEVSGALVMEDTGAKDSSGKQVNTGETVANQLKESGDFDWQDVETRDEAVKAVADGDLEFALVIPQDFSKNLQSTAAIKPDADGKVKDLDPQSAGIEIITNDANNYILTNIVKTAGTAVRDSVASEVGDQTANTLLASFTDIHSNVEQAADGAAEVSDGSVQLKSALDQIKDGTSSLSDGAVSLKDGTSTLSDGSQKLVDGQQQLADGSSTLATGADSLKQGASDAHSGAAQLADGSSKLYAGTQTFSDGADALKDGTSQLSDGAAQLKTGTSDLSAGADTLSAGTSDLATGADQLAQGTGELNSKLQKSGLNDVASGLSAVCKDLSQQSATGAGDLTQKVSEQVAANVKTQLDPLVAAGTLTQQQADQILAQVTSEPAKTDLTNLNQAALGAVDEKLGSLGSSCATDGTSTLATDITSLTGAVSQINDGAQALKDGSSSVNDGAGKLAGGARDLKTGAASLSDGADQAKQGAADLSDGAQKIEDNTKTLSEGAAALAGGTQKLADGSSTLATGANDLAEGEKTALDGQKNLAGGAEKLDSGAGELADGATALNDGAGKAQTGAGDLSSGAGQLSSGLADGEKKIPSLNEDQRKDTASTMSNPVNLDRTSLASGSNYGEGMGPFFMVLALWIGALMLVQTMRPENLRALASNAPSSRINLGSWGPFALVGVLQTLLLFAVVKWALGFDMAHPWLVFFFLGFVSLVYTAIIYGLVSLLGAPGKLVALVILIIQLVTAGGMMPYETLPHSIRWLHHVLPMGWALGGVRRLIYDIDLQAVPLHLAVLALWGVLGLLLGYLGTRKNRTWTLKTLNPEISV